MTPPDNLDPFDLFRTSVAVRVRRIHAQAMIDPAGDWPGVLFLDVPGETVDISLHRIVGLDEAGKHRLATEVLPRRIRRLGATRFCWLTPAWLDDTDPADECLALVFADRVRRAMLVAEVMRKPGRRPRLGRWQPGPRGRAPVEISGRFVEPLVAALAPLEPDDCPP